MYMYQADLYCDSCGYEIMQELAKEGKKPEDIEDYSSFDTDDYPKYFDSDTEGESDSPTHCGHCGEFLENALTSEGYKYLIDAIIRHYGKGEGKAEVIEQWIEFYNIPMEAYSSESFDYAEGCYQALCDYHSGQWSKSYSYLSVLSKHFKPSPMFNFDSMRSNDNSLAIYIQYSIKILKNNW